MPDWNECYEDAAERLLDDAEHLSQKCRWHNAGYLVGLSAECSMKHALQKAGKNVSEGYRSHLPKLRREIDNTGDRTLLESVRPALNQLLLKFDDWDISARYAANGQVTKAQFDKWHQAAKHVRDAAASI